MGRSRITNITGDVESSLFSFNRRRFFSLLAALGSGSLPTGAAETAKQGMIVRSVRPLDLEMPLDGFSTWITPIERFFVRSHHYIPKVELQEWRLDIQGEVQKQVSLTMADLEKLPQIEVVAVLECAGNGRGLYEPSMPGLQWEYGAVGNARWRGVRLADVLKLAGLKDSAREVVFDGADVPVGKMPDFQRALPLNRALHRDTLLALSMNGRPLPLEHGYPLRLVVPGWAGDCWTKWVRRINVLPQEFEGFFMKSAYRHPRNAVMPGSSVDAASMEPVTSLRVKSIIASPREGSVLGPGAARIRGVAWSGKDPVRSVEVSTDAGRTWKAARFGKEQGSYAWRLWEMEWTPPGPGYYTLMARATDSAGDTQPFVQEWNPSGYLYNAVHTIGVSVAREGDRQEPAPAMPGRGDFPPEFRRACLSCHEDDVIVQQRLTRAQWDREVDKMIRWGAPVKPEAKNSIVEFLAERYGARPRKR